MAVTLTFVTIFHLLIQTRTTPTGKKTIRAAYFLLVTSAIRFQPSGILPGQLPPP